jgi:hypothetical protein
MSLKGQMVELWLELAVTGKSFRKHPSRIEYHEGDKKC